VGNQHKFEKDGSVQLHEEVEAINRDENFALQVAGDIQGLAGLSV